MGSQRITVLGGLILVVLTVTTGIAVFAIMQRHTEHVLSASLELSLESRSRLLYSGFDNKINDVLTITTRPFLIEQIKKINQGKDAQKAQALLQKGIASFLMVGFDALAIYDANGRQIARAGDFVTDPELEVPIKLSVPTVLLWKGGLIFSTQQIFRDRGKEIGFIRSQARMPVFGELLTDVDFLGKTGELAICAPLPENNMHCFPMLLHPEPFIKLARIIKGKSLPMDYALSGKIGVLRAKDYRDEVVVAAYRPMEDTELGMVLKTDASELFHSVYDQLKYAITAVAVLIGLGMLMLRWLVTPLLKKVIVSEQQARDANTLLAEKENRVRAIFENVDDGIIVINSTGEIESANPGVECIFGYTASEMIGQDASMLLPQQVRVSAGDYLQRYLETGQSTYVGAAREVLAQRKDGTLFPMDIRVTEMNFGAATLFIGTMRDITERKQSEEKIVHLATHDALTNLPNRHLLQDRLRQAISHARRDKDIRVALLFIDLDGFKQVNDSYGHDVGDALLVEVARRICSVLRSEDTTARQGGDEFIVTLPNIRQPESPEIVAKKLIAQLAAGYLIDGHQLNISASVGVALYPDDGIDTETLLKNSDTAMYAAKMAGRGVYRFYRPEMDVKSADK